jgi:hypothetical protein
MKRWLLAILTFSMLTPTAPVWAKKKPKTSAQANKKGDSETAPPGDKRTNEGAQGRKNATEDAARNADSPQFDRRP